MRGGQDQDWSDDLELWALRVIAVLYALDLAEEGHGVLVSTFAAAWLVIWVVWFMADRRLARRIRSADKTRR